jgi:hypothetical protein
MMMMGQQPRRGRYLGLGHSEKIFKQPIMMMDDADDGPPACPLMILIFI